MMQERSGRVERRLAAIIAQTALALDPEFTIRNYRLGAATDNPTYLAGRERIYQGQ
jgi:hypothetical protein